MSQYAFAPLVLNAFSFIESHGFAASVMDYIGAFLPSNRSLAVVGSDQVRMALCTEGGGPSGTRGATGRRLRRPYGRGIDSAPKHLNMFKGASLRLPKSLSDQFPVRVCSRSLCKKNVCVPSLALDVFSFPSPLYFSRMDYVGAFLPSNRSLAVMGSDQVRMRQTT